MDKAYDSCQQQAISATGGYYLVLAPPGCGKTDILAERIVHAYKDGVPFDQMLCLTFTNRASKGMRQRIAERVGEDARRLFVGNVHHFCSTFLRQYGLIPENASIIDEDDQSDILQYFDDHFFLTRHGQIDRSRVKEINDLDAYITQRRFGQPDKVLYSREGFDEYYTIAENAGFDADHVPDSDRCKRVRYTLLYQRYKAERNVIDFTDLLVLAYEYLRSRQYPTYRWIQVDEVQDLNALQSAIIDALTASEDYTVMYLGDEQQAIFSFLGAKLSRLDTLRQRCQGHILSLQQNYRSPERLLKVFNTYAREILHVQPELLPRPDPTKENCSHDLILAHSDTADDEMQRLLRMTNYYLGFHDERLAVLVPTNAMADRVSQLLSQHDIDHFKVSGTDMFKSASYKTLASLFSVAVNEFNSIAWVRLLHGIGAVSRLMDARDLTAALRQQMMTPSDILDGEPYTAAFLQRYEHGDLVLFDTETTGLDVANDDIVQIAAFKLHNGKKVEGSDFNIILETQRSIPSHLGSIVNPLVEEYASRPHVPRQEGLEMFLEYIGNLPVVGHNVTYDRLILQHNVQRDLGRHLTLDAYDTLRLIKCVEPTLYRYKLAYLVDQLHLVGQNSHLANEDIEATHSLIEYCCRKIRPAVERQREFLDTKRIQHIKTRMQILTPLLRRLQGAITDPSAETTIAGLIADTYKTLVQQGLIDPLGEKFDIFLRYVKGEWDRRDNGESIFDQIEAHIGSMTASINECDLINSTDLISDRVMVMTVHKSKGLEFDNVVILGAIDGTYPDYRATSTLRSVYSTDVQKMRARQEIEEDARKLYVGLTRARRRLCVSYSAIDSRGYDSHLTPFLDPIRQLFHEG
jgi:DNA helicase-2/ATP-dependent DNA helicase PcrA